MEPIEFKNMACYLFNNNSSELDDEIILRTIINRYYYYIFLCLRDNIIKLDNRDKIEEILIPPNNDIKYNIGVHAFLLRYIKKVAKESKHINPHINIFKIATNVGLLLDYRKKADYKLNETVTYNELEDTKKFVKEIEDNLNDLFEVIIQLQGMKKLPDPNRYLK